MTTPLPTWLPRDRDLPHREELVRAVLDLLARPKETVCLFGPGGIGKTAVAGAVVARQEGPVLAVRLSGCRSTADVLLVVGWALGALPPGDAAAVGAALRERGPLLVVLDDADVPGVEEAWRQLRDAAAEARWLFTGVEPATTRQEDSGGEGFEAGLALPVPPLPVGSGNPLHDRLVEELDAPHSDPWQALDQLPRGSQALALLPAGLPRVVDLAEVLLEPGRPGRQLVRRATAEAMRTRWTLAPGWAAASVVKVLEPTLGLATGAPFHDAVSYEDAFALRWAGELVADPDDASRCTAAAARLFVAWGQAAAGRALLGSAARRDAQASDTARALLAWAEAEAHLALGDVENAQACWSTAETALRRTRSLPVLATVLRHHADRLAARGDVRQAAALYREAREAYRQADRADGVAATLRGAADLAVSAGETVSAEALYDQADATGSGPVETANRRIGLAGLEIARGDLGRARQLLDLAWREAADVPLVRANVHRRRAELALRRGNHALAEAEARAAITIYGHTGEQPAMATTTRLLGDIAAAGGHLEEASRHLRRALQLQVRCQDLPALQRTLIHLAALERTTGHEELAADLEHAAEQLAGRDSTTTG